MGTDSRIFKAVFVGEPKCGKTSLISSYVRGVQPPNPKPTLFDAYSKEIDVDGVRYKLHICDTSGLSDFYRLRRMSYLNTDVFIVCVDYSQGNGLYKTEKWISEIKQAHVPILLCMTKADEQKMISQEEIQQFILKHDIQGIVECSANNKKSLKHLFDMAIRITVDQVPPESYNCCGCCYR